MKDPQCIAKREFGRYVETLNLLEQVHYRMMTAVKDELDRRNEHGINWAQAVLLYQVGERDVTTSQLCEHGQFVGSNLSYNLVKLANDGYIQRVLCQRDRRSFKIRLTAKGEQIRLMLETLFERHIAALTPVANIGVNELAEMNLILERLERYRARAHLPSGDSSATSGPDHWATAA